MPTTRATVSLSTTSGLLEDNVVNVWHWNHTGVMDQTKAAALGKAIEDFYGRLFPWYSGSVERGIATHQVSFATLTPGGAGPLDDVVSKIEFFWAFPSAGPFSAAEVGGNMPSEVALCLSYQANIEGLPEETGNTRPASRQRGRLYLGPWTKSAGDTVVGAQSHPAEGVRTAILGSYETMRTEVVAMAEPFRHVVYSPTSGLTYGIAQISVDNSWDTIRSRGARSSNRTRQAVDWPMV